MLGTATLIGLCLAGISVLKRGGEVHIPERWANIMRNIGTKVHNQDKQTYQVLKVIPKQYGYDCIVSLPDGLTYEELEAVTPEIITGLCCNSVTMEHKVSEHCAYVKLITVEWDDNAKFEPVETKPYEVYLSGTEYFQDIISNMLNYPHVLISGATGSGKSILMFMILINLFMNNKSDDINIFLGQVSDKKDLRTFEDVEQVKYFANDLRKLSKMLIFLVNEVQRRNRIILKYKDIQNIHEYNKRFPNNKWQYIYLFIDEFAFLMPDELDDEEEVGLKNTCLLCLKKLAKEARSAGLYIVCGLQRPDKENMPPIFKSLLCTRIAFAQNNTASSLVVIDDGEAVHLNQREAITLIGNKRNKIKTPFLDMETVSAYVACNATPDEHFVELSEYENAIKDAEIIGGQILKDSKKKCEYNYYRENQNNPNYVNPRQSKNNKNKKQKQVEPQLESAVNEEPVPNNLVILNPDIIPKSKGSKGVIE